MTQYFTDWRIFSGDLENGGDTFELMPRWISSKHLHHGTTQTPRHTHIFSTPTQTVSCLPLLPERLEGHVARNKLLKQSALLC